MRATAKDLRFYSKDILNAVNRGEEVVITFRGKPCAKLIPYNEGYKGEESDLFGMWKDNKKIGDVSDYVRELRKGRY